MFCQGGNYSANRRALIVSAFHHVDALQQRRFFGVEAAHSSNKIKWISLSSDG
jgi:hypothetical protein